MLVVKAEGSIHNRTKFLLFKRLLLNAKVNVVRKTKFCFCNRILIVQILFLVELKRDFSQVFIVFAGLEPKSFKSLFPFWEDRLDVAKINQEVS